MQVDRFLGRIVLQVEPKRFFGAMCTGFHGRLQPSSGFLGCA